MLVRNVSDARFLVDLNDVRERVHARISYLRNLRASVGSYTYGYAADELQRAHDDIWAVIDRLPIEFSKEIQDELGPKTP